MNKFKKIIYISCVILGFGILTFFYFRLSEKSSTQIPTPLPSQQMNAAFVSISHGSLVGENGTPLLIKGLIMRPVVATAQFEPTDAYSHFGEAELTAAHQWGANTVRILVSQPGLDPQDPMYSKAYVTRVSQVAQEILNDGFILDIGINYEKPTGASVLHCMPTAATERAWNTLLSLPLAQPQYQHSVMLELFNEPVTKYRDATAWEAWQNGAPAGSVAPYGTCAADDTIVGMNTLITQIRKAGLKNIIIADGLGWAHWLDPQYPLNDPLGQLAYAVHPFLENWKDFNLTNNQNDDYKVLDSAFGDMRENGPVIATAVAGGSGGKNCQQDTPQVMPILLAYLKNYNMGAIGWVFDLPHNSLTLDWNYTPTSYDNFHCPKSGVSGEGGSGQLLQNWFLNN